MKADELKKIAVIGLGKMGGDWVVNLLESGYEVVGFDLNRSIRENVMKQVTSGLKWIAKNRKTEEPEFVEKTSNNFKIIETEDLFLEEAKSCQIYLEVVFEDLLLKCELLSKHAPNLAENTIIWTNTSSLSVHTMGVASKRPEKFIGTHGMNPVYMMPAVEVVRHKELSQVTLDFTIDVLKRMGKKPFVASDVSGFWVNKHLVPFMLEAYRALERGEITVEDGDNGLRFSLGHPQGVFKLSDFIGADTMYRVSMAMYIATQDPRLYPPNILARMFKNNELGLKTGKGFYEWEGSKPVRARDFSEFIIKDSGTILNL